MQTHDLGKMSLPYLSAYKCIHCKSRDQLCYLRNPSIYYDVLTSHGLHWVAVGASISCFMSCIQSRCCIICISTSYLFRGIKVMMNQQFSEGRSDRTSIPSNGTIDLLLLNI